MKTSWFLLPLVLFGTFIIQGLCQDTYRNCVFDNFYTTTPSVYQGKLSPSDCRKSCQVPRAYYCLAWNWTWTSSTPACTQIGQKRYRTSRWANGPANAPGCIPKPSECLKTQQTAYVKNTGSGLTKTGVDCDKTCKKRSDCTLWNWNKRSKRCYFKFVTFRKFYGFVGLSGPGYFC